MARILGAGMFGLCYTFDSIAHTLTTYQAPLVLLSSPSFTPSTPSPSA